MFGGLLQAISVAQMQGHLVLHRLDPFMAVAAADFTVSKETAEESEAEPVADDDDATGSTVGSKTEVEKAANVAAQK